MSDNIEDAEDLETLGTIVRALAKKSTATYTDASVSAWKILFGEEQWNAEKLTKSATKLWGQAAADATNAAVVVKKLATFAAPKDDGGNS